MSQLCTTVKLPEFLQYGHRDRMLEKTRYRNQTKSSVCDDLIFRKNLQSKREKKLKFKKLIENSKSCERLEIFVFTFTI